MYSLIKFENNKHWVAPSSSVTMKGDEYVAKYKGGRYQVELLLKSDDKKFLAEYSKRLLKAASPNMNAEKDQSILTNISKHTSSNCNISSSKHATQLLNTSPSSILTLNLNHESSAYSRENISNNIIKSPSKQNEENIQKTVDEVYPKNSGSDSTPSADNILNSTENRNNNTICEHFLDSSQNITIEDPSTSNISMIIDAVELNEIKVPATLLSSASSSLEYTLNLNHKSSASDATVISNELIKSAPKIIPPNENEENIQKLFDIVYSDNSGSYKNTNEVNVLSSTESTTINTMSEHFLDSSQNITIEDPSTSNISMIIDAVELNEIKVPTIQLSSVSSSLEYTSNLNHRSSNLLIKSAPKMIPPNQNEENIQKTFDVVYSKNSGSYDNSNAVNILNSTENTTINTISDHFLDKSENIAIENPCTSNISMITDTVELNEIKVPATQLSKKNIPSLEYTLSLNQKSSASDVIVISNKLIKSAPNIIHPNQNEEDIQKSFDIVYSDNSGSYNSTNEVNVLSSTENTTINTISEHFLDSSQNIAIENPCISNISMIIDTVELNEIKVPATQLLSTSSFLKYTLNLNHPDATVISNQLIKSPSKLLPPSQDRDNIKKTFDVLYSPTKNNFSKHETDLPCCSKNILNSTESTYISTPNNTFSEYFPDSSQNITNEEPSATTNISVEKNSTMISDPVELNGVKVLHRSNASKKHFCIFCKTLQTKLARHFFLKHMSEKQIKEAFHFPVKSRERLNILNELRKQGDFLHNTTTENNTGILIVSRQQQANRKNTVNNYVCCKKCKGFFAKNALRNHMKRCGKQIKNARDNLICSRTLTQYIHKDANYTVRNAIFPVLRDDDITRIIRYDHLVIVYANFLTLKHTLKHQEDMIRSRLRLLGRFLIAMQNADNNINELKDIFKPSLFDTCVEALRRVANWDDNLRCFKTPAVAQDLSSLIKKVGKRLNKELIKAPNPEEKIKNLQNFMILWESDIPVLINQKALENQISQKRTKKEKLPSKDDIKKLYLYLKSKMFDSIAILEKEFDFNSWNDLVKTSLIFIQIFNRRRAGEIERLSIRSYLNKESITENVDKDILNNMTNESLDFAKQFVRLTLRGKLGRTVSVLLSPIDVTAIDLILKYQSVAGVTKENEFIFARKVTSKFAKPYYRACPLLKQFSEECGAEFPESLRGTFLRKHIATYTSLLNIEDATVDRLANFMGHHKDIHKSIYRVPVPVAEITCISKLLMAAVGGEEENEEEEDEENDDNIEQYDECLQQQQEGYENQERDESKTRTNTSLISIKKRSTSPCGKIKRIKWTQDERDVIYEVFGDLKKMDRLPTTKKCCEVISNNDVLKNRSAAQLKSWIDHQRRYK